MFNAIEFLQSPRNRKIKLGLKRISLLQEKLGNPEKALRFVHVAGTNGKGSTCAFIESCLRQQGYKTGLFTSPYIEHFEERIRVNNINIAETQLANQTLRVKAAAEEVFREIGEYPTEFELMTAVAFCHFEDCKCDICVIEVGLGGRFDSTNIINPDVCVITKISMDHMNLLGNSILEIAYEKAGIIKKNVDVVTSPQRQEVMDVIKNVAKDNDCNLYLSREITGKLEFKDDKLVQSFDIDGQNYTTFLLGSYQPQNAGTAILALKCLENKGFKISNENIVNGIKDTKWSGRCEFFQFYYDKNNLYVVVDGAHNVDGATKLVETIKNCKKALNFVGKTICVFGILKDKDYEAVINEVEILSNEIYLYPPNSDRALSPRAAAKFFDAEKNCIICNNAREALKEAILKNSQGKSHLFVICLGSLYSISELKNCLSEINF